MKIVLDEELRELLRKKKKNIISVEIAKSDHSDFEVSEIFLRLVSRDFADYLIKKKRCRELAAESGESVLLPAYKLEYEETVRFGLKKRGLFQKITWFGIKL